MTAAAQYLEGTAKIILWCAWCGARIPEGERFGALREGFSYRFFHPGCCQPDLGDTEAST